VSQLLVTANVVLSSLILLTLKIEAILSSETSVLTRASRHHIPKDGIVHRQPFTEAVRTRYGLVLSPLLGKFDPEMLMVLAFFGLFL
jgi:hypothetical protein